MFLFYFYVLSLNYNLTMLKQYFRCKCYLWANYYSNKLQCHVDYFNRYIFLERYDKHLRDLSPEETERLIEELETEKERRMKLTQQAIERRENIIKHYQPLNKDVYKLDESYLARDFLKLVDHAKDKSATYDFLCKLVKVNAEKKLFTFPVLTEEFCDRLVEELEHFEASDLPKARPNTMNNYGITLEELGFYENLITPLRENYLNPICCLLFPEWTGQGLDSHKAFVVVYKMGQNLDLNTHYDNAEVTLNISLGTNFEGGSLYIGKMRNEPRSDKDYTEVTHKATFGVLHRGQQLHGALPINDGARYNLIIWMRSSTVRNKHPCPMCDQTPDLEPVPIGYFGDGFTNEPKPKETVDVCTLT